MWEANVTLFVTIQSIHCKDFQKNMRNTEMLITLLYKITLEHMLKEKFNFGGGVTDLVSDTLNLNNCGFFFF